MCSSKFFTSTTSSLLGLRRELSALHNSTLLACRTLQTLGWTWWEHIPWGCMKFSYLHNIVELSPDFQMPLELARKIVICQYVSIVRRLVLQKFKQSNTTTDKRTTYNNKNDHRYCVVYRIPEHSPLGETNHLKNTTPSANKNIGFQNQPNKKAPILK